MCITAWLYTYQIMYDEKGIHYFMKMTTKVTLRGREYQAEHLTDINILPILNLFVGSNGRELPYVGLDISKLSQEMKAAISKPIMDKLSKASVLDDLARSLTAIFPTLPPDLVAYSRDSFTFNLEISELRDIALAVGAAINEKNKDTTVTPVSETVTAETLTQTSTATYTQQDIDEKQVRLVDIEQELTILRGLPDFPGRNSRIDNLSEEELSLSAWLGNAQKVV